MERLAAELTASVPKACNGWGETMGPYRFFGNAAIDFNGQSARGLGPLSYEAQRGMYLHPTYAVTTEREPLGILDAWMWAREKKMLLESAVGRKKACAGSRVTNGWPNWRRNCPPRAWCTWPTAKRTWCP